MDADDSLGGFKLVWADFPTSLTFSNIGNAIPNWNMFGDDIVESAFALASEFLHFDGTMVCTLRMEHLGVCVREANDSGFHLDRTLFLHLPQKMYVNLDNGQETVGVFMCIVVSTNFINI